MFKYVIIIFILPKFRLYCFPGQYLMKRATNRGKRIFFFSLLIFVFCLSVVFLYDYFKPEDKQVSAESVVDKNEKIVRQPFVAGRFYPGDKKTLTEVLGKMLDNHKAKPYDGKIKAIIAPHAGYMFSGQMAAKGFVNIEEKYDKVFIISGNHNSEAVFPGISIPDVTHYKTPLGEIPLSPIAVKLKKDHPDLYTTNEHAHKTHIIEAVLPFLQYRLSDFEIIPMITGAVTGKDIERAATVVSDFIDESTLIVISTDLSHYRPYKKAGKLDIPCIEAIANLDVQKTALCEACALSAVKIMIHIALRNDYKGDILGYMNSGDSGGGMESVVGYTSILFSEKNEEISTESRRFLTTLARKTIKNTLTNNRMPEVITDSLPDETRLKRGCFVTLEKNHRLRGCIGSLAPEDELHQCVTVNTVKAALNDGRFKPVTLHELEDIKIEISVLSRPEKLSYKDPEKLLSFLVPLKHGVILRNDYRRSTFLPQVWSSFNDKDDFLSSLCKKGGMKNNCWKDSDTEIFVYTAQVFSE